MANSIAVGFASVYHFSKRWLEISEVTKTAWSPVSLSIRSIVEPIPELDKNFPWIQIVPPAERQTVIQQNSAIRNVYTGYAHRKPFAKIPAYRNIKRRVAGKVIRTGRRVPICEP